MKYKSISARMIIKRNVQFNITKIKDLKKKMKIESLKTDRWKAN